MLLPKLQLLSCAIFAICCPDPAADGARPPAVRTTARPYTAGRPTPPRLIFMFRRGYRLCSGVICNPPERGAGLRRIANPAELSRSRRVA